MVGVLERLLRRVPSRRHVGTATAIFGRKRSGRSLGRGKRLRRRDRLAAASSCRGGAPARAKGNLLPRGQRAPSSCAAAAGRGHRRPGFGSLVAGSLLWPVPVCAVGGERLEI